MSRFQSTRRQFFGLAAGGAAATALTIPHESQARTQTRARIVIIGAGAGGTALANRLVRRLEEARITLIDPRPTFVITFSNENVREVVPPHVLIPVRAPPS